MIRDHYDNVFKKMVSIGDSITAGGAATSKELCWVSRLGRLISEFQEEELQVVNKGIGANVLVDKGSSYEMASRPSGKERYRRDVIDNHPDLVTIAFGINDLRGGTSVHQFIDDLDFILKDIKRETNALVVVLSTYFIVDFGNPAEPWGKASLESFMECNAEILTCALRNDALFADVFSSMGEAPWIVDKDKIHPNNLGHALIADKVFEVIASHCSALSKKAYKDALKFTPWREK